MELAIKILKSDGLPKTGLTTSDFRFLDSSDNVISWSGTATEYGTQGNYVLDSVNFTYQKCKLQVQISSGNWQTQTWFGLQYLGDIEQFFAKLSGFTMSGDINMNNKILYAPSDPVSGNQVGDRDFNDGRYLALSGGTMSGDINMALSQILNLPDPTSDKEPVTRIYLTNLLLNYLTLSGGTMSGILNMGGYKITNPGAPGSDDDVAKRGYNDSRYLKKQSGSSDSCFSIIDFGDGSENIAVPKIKAEIGHFNDQYHAVNRKFVAYLIQEYLNASLTPYQQSENIMRIIYNGTLETDRVYQTIKTGFDAAKVQASATKQITLLIEGNGKTGSNPTNYNLVSPSDIFMYIHLLGLTPDTNIRVINDAYSVGIMTGDRGKVILKNLKVTNSDGGSNTTFQRFVFENCTFEFTDGTLYFDTCEFRGVNVIKATTLRVDDTKGTLYYTTAVPTENGDVPPYVLSSNI